MKVITGDCVEVMRTLPDRSVDAIVSDPPYGLSFMNRGWDHEVPGPGVWAECLRVIKPGGYLLAFGGTRKFHRMTCAIEDASGGPDTWEIRDCIMWLYGQGMPKVGDVGKAIDKAGGDGDDHDGWSAALKPAWEPIIVARRSLEGTLLANVVAHGTGAMNIEACRIGDGKRVPASVSRHQHDIVYGGFKSPDGLTSGFDPNVGQYPANLVLDEAAAAQLDAQVGPLRSGGIAAGQARGANQVFGKMDGAGVAPRSWSARDDVPPSRFFYCAKATRRERNLGVVDNRHPTVKPLRLMRWLVRLVARRGGLVLDPFTGSGTTGVACWLEGVDFLGIELDPTHAEVARRRIEAAGGEADAGEDEDVVIEAPAQGSLF
jgi:hypothetical protein